jgi:hypothetical protein
VHGASCLHDRGSSNLLGGVAAVGDARAFGRYDTGDSTETAGAGAERPDVTTSGSAPSRVPQPVPPGSHMVAA